MSGHSVAQTAAASGRSNFEALSSRAAASRHGSRVLLAVFVGPLLRLGVSVRE
jgi:hypothetical protein